MTQQVKAIKNHDDDNVATVFGEVEAGTTVSVLDKRGTRTDITVRGKIPYGHKIALKEIAPGEEVTKYGEEIGIATKPIVPGEHVHIQNIDSIRGRGDWAKQGENR